MCIKKTTIPVVSSLNSMSPDELLSLSCPALIYSSLLEVTETFTDNEPEKEKFSKYDIGAEGNLKIWTHN